MSSVGLCWLRRDLRVHDHAALEACLRNHDHVYVCFVFDKHILEPLQAKSRHDSRMHFIAQSLLEVHLALKVYGGGVIFLKGDPEEELKKITRRLNVTHLYYHRDYSPYAQKRDAGVEVALKNQGVTIHSLQDHVIMEPEHILNKEGRPYLVYTPYSKAWLGAFNPDVHLKAHNVCWKKLPFEAKFFDPSCVQDLLEFSGFLVCEPFLEGGSSAGLKQLKRFQDHVGDYERARDYPALDRTSKLSVYIRHGCISVRDMVKLALAEQASSGADKWLKEIIWREFYQSLMFHFPHSKTQAFHPIYDNLLYTGSEELFQAWVQGQTGFPLIDAAMRCFSQTGWMHNRLRMITASFLCKTLLCSWKKGERYFAWKLLDYEMASNNGGWQWVAGTGCDAAPYFRIFNPWLQSEKFDPEGVFIRQYCPELKELNPKDIHRPAAAKSLPKGFVLGQTYPKEIVDFKAQRILALHMYEACRSSKG